MSGRGFRVWVLVLAACVRAPPPIASDPEPVAAPAAVSTVPEPAVAPPATPKEPRPPPTVEGVLAAMTLEDKVGQLMMVGFAGKAVDPSIATLVRGFRVGGVCLFARNVGSAPQIGQLNDDVRALLSDGVPPFIAVDQEGGNVVRVSDGNLVLPGNMLLGATRQPELAYEAGLAQGEDLWRLGFNMNLAPVLDVNTNPANPVIGIRAFGDDVKLVATMGAAFVRGQQDAKLVTVAKHFPGHGSVDADSHRALPVVRASAKEVRRQLEPFRAAFEAGLDGLMTAHIATPSLTGDETPATLSERVLGGVLREELKFDGLVLTDELEMDAIDRQWGVGRAAVLAVNAGADMVLIPWRMEKKEEVHQALLEAAKSGAIPSARLDQAVRRILTVKLRRGLFDALPPLSERLATLGEKKGVAARIANAGVTLLRTKRGVFPVRPSQQGRVAVISAEATLVTALSKRIPGLASLTVPAFPSPRLREELKQKARTLAEQADLVIVGVVNSRQIELLSMVALAGKPVVLVVMGAPYLAAQGHDAAVVLTTYSYREAATEAAAAALLGERGTPGRLPVSLPSLPFGHGLDPTGRRVVELDPGAHSSSAGRR